MDSNVIKYKNTKFNNRYARQYIQKYFVEEIIVKYDTKDKNLIKILLRIILIENGLNIKFPYFLFSDMLTIENRKYKPLITDKKLLLERCDEIIKVIQEELYSMMDIKCKIELKDISKTIIYDTESQEVVLLKFNVIIDNFQIVTTEDGFSFILKDDKNSTFYQKSDKNFNWVGTYNINECKIFSNLEEIAELIHRYKFIGITIVKIPNLSTNSKSIIPKNEVHNNFYSEELSDNYNLYNWQKSAYKNWMNNDFIGVIEAVTGSGKSLLAKFAIQIHLENDYEILILVPGVELQEQWYNLLREFKKYGIHKIGGDKKFVYHSRWKIHIAVVHSAAKFIFTPKNNKGLVIADECHHYGSVKFSKALNPYFHRRMGLTATYERQDNGIEKYLNSYFKNICYSLSYKEALAENVIAHFIISYVGIYMNDFELKQYKEYDSKCFMAKKMLEQAGVKYKTFGEFIRQVGILCKGFSPLSELAMTYITNFSRKRSLLANLSNKYECLTDNEVIKQIKKSNGTIIFAQTKESAEIAIDRISSHNISAKTVKSGMKKQDVRNVLAEFESGDTDVIAAPLLLDEGIDVPSADLAIILASHRNKRQMIQRLGRVLRKKPNNKKAIIIVIYGINTTEDPKLGAHEDFMEEIIEVADSINFFEYDNTINGLVPKKQEKQIQNKMLSLTNNNVKIINKKNE